MLQLTQNLKSGKMELSDVPVPALSGGRVLVRNHYSVISAGTEGGKVETARKGYIGKAKEKPAQVKQVIDTLKSEGIASTYRRVMNKLDALTPLGYSAAGVVEAVGENVTRFKVGDRVASGGEGANHAEVSSVPENLVVKVPDAVKLEHAAYSTIAAIAVQGVRQADLRLGESCAIIGLGLLGQLTVQVLKAAGVKVAGIDIDPDMVELAGRSGADIVFTRGSGDEERAIIDFSDGYGVDAVIITAGSSSLDPVELAGRLCRKKGKVVIVGAVPTGFSRENYYKKELELRMATSYGPGRYDPNYEEKGQDYPIGYVRWTENRNMQAFLQLVADGKINLSFLTIHEFEFEKAPDAYQIIVERSEPYIGIVLKYDTEKEAIRSIDLGGESRRPSAEGSRPRVSFIGAGSFAQNLLLPNIKDSVLVSVATSQGHTSKNVAQKWKFKKATCDAKDVFEDDSNTVFIATRHDSHAEYVMRSLEAGKNVFVEKPLCMTEQELEGIAGIYNRASEGDAHRLMVGFNRRFAPHVRSIKRAFTDKVPKSINYRVNAGAIPADHWIQDREIGGGRIIGEVCHFIDLAMYLAGALPKSLSATAMEDPLGLLDTLNVNILFMDGSIANVSYFANGSKAMKKERLEVFSSGKTAVLDDFTRLDIFTSKKTTNKKLGQDKGHRREVEEFLDSVRNGKPAPIPFEEIYYSTKMSFDIMRSINTGETIRYVL
jgi:predicted dehydrogenase/threonine dehydrogenase-like Zn-dependent dehydrogenase